MENGLCQEMDDNEIKWKFQEILQLLRCFKEHIFDFQQIANKMMRGAEDSNLRSKYTPQICESAFKKILELSRDKPYYVELFETIPYTQQIHGFKLLEQYEEYNLKITEFVDKTLLNDKFKHMLVAMERNELSPEMAEKITNFCKAFPSLVQMAVGIEHYDKALEKRSIFESLMPERDKITNFQDLHNTLTKKAEDFRVKKEAEASDAVVTPSSSTPAKFEAPSPRLPGTKLSKTTPVTTTAAGPSKRFQPPSRPSSSSRPGKFEIPPPKLFLPSPRLPDTKLQKSTPITTSGQLKRFQPSTSRPSSSSTPGKFDTPPSKLFLPSSRLPETKLPKSTPVTITAAGSSKRFQPSTSRPSSSSKSSLRDTPSSKLSLRDIPPAKPSPPDAPPAKKKKWSSSSKIPAIDPVVIEKSSKKNRRPSSSGTTKKSADIPHHKTPKPPVVTCDGATQTYLSLVVELEKTKTPVLVEKHRDGPNRTGKRRGNKRTVMTQTGEIHFEFANDMGTINWYDDGDIPNEKTVELVNACLRSNIDYESEKPMRVNMNLKGDNIVTSRYIEELKKHPLYEIFLKIQEADVEEFFYYPVKIEVSDYPSWIRMPMDLLTIEDLMIQGKIKDIDDLEFFTMLMSTNAVVFGKIADYAEKFAEKLADIFNEYRSKNQK